MASQSKGLQSFLKPESRLDLKSTALEYVVGLTGSEEGRKLIKRERGVVKQLIELTRDQQDVIAKDAYLALLNLSGAEYIADIMLEMEVDLISTFLEVLVDPSCAHADKVCMILSNLTRHERGTIAFIKAISQAPSQPSSVGASSSSSELPSLYQILDIFNRKDFNSNANFHYVATLFSNITQNSVARQLFLDRTKCIIPKLLPYTQFAGSTVRKGGVIGLLRNLCFEVGAHQWLLSDEVDLLPSLLLPLAGPEQFEEEEVDKLPDDLQYLPDDKQREPDPDIRKMLVEAIMKLCATKFGREYLREKQTYLIMRELHKWEKDRDVKESCEKLVGILISDEPGPGMENLHEVKLSDHQGEETSSRAVKR